MKNIALRTLSIIIFSFGVLAGMAFFVGATWADVESVFYGFNRYGNEMTSSMRCPVLITRTEPGIITATFKNTTDQLIRPTARFQASNVGAFRTETSRMSLEPGQEQTLEWTVTSDDMVLDRFIFAKIFTFASYPMKDVEQTCGILVLDLPGLTGGQIAIIVIAVSLAGLVGGSALWSVAHRPLKDHSMEAMRAMLTLTATVVFGLVSTLFAWWLLGVLLSALSLILVGVIIGNFVSTAKA
ncbi:MAG: hypothetical protein HY781_13095 [Chloroflexi bacterium]|nr:hypothetical protein [Chloroflexota bacterium]